MGYVSSIDVAALGEGLGDLDGRALAARLAEIEHAIRSLEAAAVAVIATADRHGVYAEDGHVSVRGWTKATVRLSNAEVTHRIRRRASSPPSRSAGRHWRRAPWASPGPRAGPAAR